jgi:hypothetical protein
MGITEMPYSACLALADRACQTPEKLNFVQVRLMLKNKNLSQHILWLHVLLVSVSFPMQVLAGDPHMALVAYVPIIFLFASVALNHRLWVKNLNSSDLIFIAAFCYPVLHAGFTLVQERTATEAELLKYPIIFMSSALIYVYARFIASRKAISLALTALICVSLVFAAYWLYDSYLRTAMRDVSAYSFKMYDYIVKQNDFEFNEVNFSVIGFEYRSYGLLSKHSFTGALLALGFLTLVARTRGYPRLISFWAGFLVIFVGGASLALVGFVFAYIALVVAENYREPRQAIIKIISALLLVFTSIVLVSMAKGTGIGILFQDRLALLLTQFRFFTNFGQLPIDTGYGLISTSFPAIYRAESISLLTYLAGNPSVLLFGEGFRDLEGNGFARGGDFAPSELIVTYGIFMLGLIFYAVYSRLATAGRSLSARNSPQREDAYPVFNATFFVCMLLISATLIHYNVIFQKEILSLLALFLAIPVAAGPAKNDLAA